MKRFIAIALAVLMLLSMTACTGSGSAETTAPVETTTPIETSTPATLPTYAETENPVVFFWVTLGENYENIRALSVFANEDGTAHVEYVGDVKKVGDLNANVFHGITAALNESGLAELNGQEVWNEGEANGSMYIELADGTFIAAGFGGEIPQAYTDGYAAMDAFFAEMTAVLPEYVPQPQVMGAVDDALLTELTAIINASGIEAPDTYIISAVPMDEFFTYTLGLSSGEGITTAAQCAPMMMTTAYSLSIVQLDTVAADLDAVCADFAANVDWQKWVCVMPTDALVATKDGMALCLVAEGELYAQTKSGIEAAGWTVVETLSNPV